MLQFASNERLQDEERKTADKAQEFPVIKGLAAHVKSAFDDAAQIRTTTNVTERILKSRRLKSGLYDDDKLQQILAKGGSQLFFNITESKCESFNAWLGDTFSPSGERIWDADITPIPSLPEEMAETVVQQTVQAFGNQPGADPEMIQQFASDLYDETLTLLIEEAEKKKDRMVQKMEDQMAEGGWTDALIDFIDDLGTYPSAILKGPVMMSKKRLAWENGQVIVKTETIPTWSCVDPFNFYPGPNSRGVHESYICEVVDFDKADLAKMRNVQGWNAKALDEVISMTGRGSSFSSLNLSGETEKAVMENKRTFTNEGLPDSNIRAIEYWGGVQGILLKEWGMKGVEDNNEFYDVQCVLIGTIVVKAIMNPDPIGKRPYYVDAFVNNKNSLWGLSSLPEKMEDCQIGCNGAQRNLMNNLAIASGPMVSVDIDAIPASHLPTIGKIAPWKFFPYHGQKILGARKAIDFFQPDSNAAELTTVTEFYKNEADERTLIPRYATGDQDATGAASTASGLSMLMNAASRGIKRVIKSVDKNVIHPAIERLYALNMMSDEIDDDLKGDVQIVPQGVLAQLVKEQTQLRRQEFLTSTLNPTDMAIIGIEGRATVLRSVVIGLDLPVEKIVPSEEDMKQPQLQPEQQQEQVPAQQQEIA